MQQKFIQSAIVAATLAVAAAGVHAQDGFAALAKVKATPMTEAQMSQVEGKVHIYRLVEFRGVELPDRAEMATRAAAPTPQGGDFRRTPSREARAFDFLN